jgi:hypothetical protein
MTDDVIAGMIKQLMAHAPAIDRRKILPRVSW